MSKESSTTHQISVFRTHTERKPNMKVEVTKYRSKINITSPRKRFIPEIEIECDPLPYPKTPEDWEKHTDYGKPVIIFSGYAHATALDTEGIKLYQVEQDAMTQSDELLPRYPLKEPRRDPSKWRSKASLDNLLLPFIVLEFRLGLLRNGHFNSVISSEESIGVVMPEIRKRGKQRLYRVHPFTR